MRAGASVFSAALTPLRARALRDVSMSAAAARVAASRSATRASSRLIPLLPPSGSSREVAPVFGVSTSAHRELRHGAAIVARAHGIGIDQGSEDRYKRCSGTLRRRREAGSGHHFAARAQRL